MYNTTTLTAVITSTGLIVVALIGIITARLARKSGLEQTRAKERDRIVVGYDRLNADLETRNAKLVHDIEKLNVRIDECAIRLDHQRNYSQLLTEIMRRNSLVVPNLPPEMIGIHNVEPQKDPPS